MNLSSRIPCFSYTDKSTHCFIANEFNAPSSVKYQFKEFNQPTIPSILVGWILLKKKNITLLFNLNVEQKFIHIVGQVKNIMLINEHTFSQQPRANPKESWGENNMIRILIYYSRVFDLFCVSSTETNHRLSKIIFGSRELIIRYHSSAENRSSSIFNQLMLSTNLLELLNPYHLSVTTCFIPNIWKCFRSTTNHKSTKTIKS